MYLLKFCQSMKLLAFIYLFIKLHVLVLQRLVGLLIKASAIGAADRALIRF